VVDGLGVGGLGVLSVIFVIFVKMKESLGVGRKGLEGWDKFF
jgi:hypothetical protein